MNDSNTDIKKQEQNGKGKADAQHKQQAAAGGQGGSQNAGATASDAYKNETGDPGRTPGSAEGVEDFEKTGNE